jgi:hypothetical protein
MERHWLARPATIRKLWIAFIIVLVAVVLAELFVAHEPHFGIDGSFGFHAWYGLAACGVMIFGAKFLGLFLRRPDTYYEEDE